MLGLLRGAKRSFGWNVLGEQPTMQKHAPSDLTMCPADALLQMQLRACMSLCITGIMCMQNNATLSDEMVWQAGNLVDMGNIAFAPATPEVLKLALHLRRSHELFGDVFHGVFRYSTPAKTISGCTHLKDRIHKLNQSSSSTKNWRISLTRDDCDFRTESDAEDFISNASERLWALVVFNSGPSAAGSGTSCFLLHPSSICIYKCTYAPVELLPSSNLLLCVPS